MKQTTTHQILLIDSKRLLNYAILILLALSQSSCFRHFYQTNTTVKVDTSRLQMLEAENKYFIVHTPADVFVLTNLKMDDVSISGDRNLLDKKHDKYLNPLVGQANQFPVRESEIVFSEVHLYTRDTVEENGHVKLAIDQIFRVDIYKPDKAADKRSKTASIIGIVSVPVIGIGIFAFVFASAISSL